MIFINSLINVVDKYIFDPILGIVKKETAMAFIIINFISIIMLFSSNKLIDVSSYADDLTNDLVFDLDQIFIKLNSFICSKETLFVIFCSFAYTALIIKYTSNWVKQIFIAIPLIIVEVYFIKFSTTILRIGFSDSAAFGLMIVAIIYFIINSGINNDVGDSMNLTRNLFFILIMLYRRIWSIVLIILILFGKSDFKNDNFIYIMIVNLIISLFYIPIYKHKQKANVFVNNEYFNSNYYIFRQLSSFQYNLFICQSKYDSLSDNSEKCYLIKHEINSDKYEIMNSYDNIDIAEKYFYRYFMYN